MSERGTFVTSYLYDEIIVLILQATLPKLAHTVIEHIGKVFDIKRPVWFAGQIKGIYSGEEAELAERWVEEILIPALPSKHGLFSLVVLPEMTKQLLIFSFMDSSRYD